MFVAADGGEQFLELSARETERSDVRANDVLAQVFIHFDDHGTGNIRLRHDQVIAFCARFDAASELTDIAQLLPGNSLHALALNSDAAL
jgi:hypothetical protein